MAGGAADAGGGGSGTGGSSGVAGVTRFILFLSRPPGRVGPGFSSHPVAFKWAALDLLSQLLSQL